MRRLRFIVFVGVDGSGKTSLAKLLVKYLQNKGYRVLYVWIKSLHLLAYYISRLFEMSNRFEVIVNPNGVVIKRFNARSLGSFSVLWPFIEFISVLPWVILKVFLPVFLGYIVVADRYLIDTIVTVSTRVGNPNLSQSFFGKALMRLVPNGTVIILLNTSLETVLKRREDVEYTYQEIRDQILLYRVLAKKCGAYEFDTTEGTLKENFDKIVRKLSL